MTAEGSLKCAIYYITREQVHDRLKREIIIISERARIFRRNFTLLESVQHVYYAVNDVRQVPVLRVAIGLQ